jgi:succinate dehydrogenase hydrophobic anchor subunit
MSSEKSPIPAPATAKCAEHSKSLSGVTLTEAVFEKAGQPQAGAALSKQFDLEAQAEVPKRSRFASIRYTVLDIYRRLFTLVFFANVAAFIAIMVTDRKLLALGNAAAANLLACGLARQPLVVNSIFLVVCSIPRSAPLRLRRIASKVYHYGGVHSGCGVASLVWYGGFVGWLSHEYWSPAGGKSPVSAAPVVLAYILLALLLMIIIVAHPLFRFKRHDYFELTHRFTGWLVILLFVVLVLVFAHEASQAEHKSLGRYLIEFPAFWLLMVAAAAIIHPWVFLRKVKVQPEYLSPHAVRLHFDYTNTSFGKGTQLSKHPLRDWHGFATFPDPDNKGFSCLVSKAGDWTAATIKEQPTHLWKRWVLVYGFAYAMRVFKRVVVVTTGSGIGPCLSFLGDDCRPELRVVWQTRAPSKTYGEGIQNLVSQMDPNPVIIDTNQTGRIDMSPIVRRVAQEHDAEAVCVISNPVLTKKIVYELEATGTPAFGPIFDS